MSKPDSQTTKWFTLYLHRTGPKLVYLDGMLFVNDLNPEKEIKFRMSRKELFSFGMKAIKAAVMS